METSNKYYINFVKNTSANSQRFTENLLYLTSDNATVREIVDFIKYNLVLSRLKKITQVLTF